MMWGKKKHKQDAPDVEVLVPEILGFDTPKELQVEDRLDRVRIAERVYTLLTELPPDWSVRVGLLGQWGEGKTTICKWVAKQAKSAGHVVVWYNPWSARTLQTMWIEFAAEIMRGLDAVGIEIEGSALLRAKLGYQKWSDAPRQAAQAHLYSKAAAGVIDATANLVGILKIGPNDIQRMREKLGKLRVIIVVDDLDRTDPVLLPQLLLSFREVLDLTGFSFLLPFEDTVVAAALHNYNKALNGAKFLEKILDFRVRIPAASSAQIQELFTDEMKRHCPFVPINRIAAIFDLLPSNPRRLKALVRNLVPFKTEAARHKAEELDWYSIVIASMIRLESEIFYDAYTKVVFMDAEKNPWLEILMSQHGKDEITDKLLEQVLVDTTGDDASLRERLRTLCERWRELNGLQNLGRIRYVLKMIDQPDALTWAEYDALFSVWRKNESGEGIKSWVEAQAAKKGYDVDHLVRELTGTIIAAYSERLEAAASVALEREHVPIVNEAAISLKLLAYLALRHSGTLDVAPASPALLQRFLDVFATWANFRGNEVDVLMREAEREFLCALVSATTDQWKDILSIIRKWADQRDNPGVMEMADELVAILRPQIESDALDRLRREGGMFELLPYESMPDVKKSILDPADPMWTPAGESRGEALLKKAVSMPAIQKNAIALLELIYGAATKGAQRIDKTVVRNLIADRRLMRAIWSAAIATPLQFRSLQGMRELRGWLVGLGADEGALTVPEWLSQTKP